MSANFTTSALKNCFVFNLLTGTVVEGRFQCIHFCHYPAPCASVCLLAVLKSAQSHEQRLHGVSLRMHVAHRRFNVIVARHVLQRKRVGVLAGLGQEGVAESVEPGIRMGLDDLPQIADLGFEHPRSEWPGRVAGMGEDVGAL
ncbi:MAG: hypothetical protein WBG54_11815 [Acidobacteriaceae bacterium]